MFAPHRPQHRLVPRQARSVLSGTSRLWATLINPEVALATRLEVASTCGASALVSSLEAATGKRRIAGSMRRAVNNEVDDAVLDAAFTRLAPLVTHDWVLDALEAFVVEEDQLVRIARLSLRLEHGGDVLAAGVLRHRLSNWAVARLVPAAGMWLALTERRDQDRLLRRTGVLRRYGQEVLFLARNDHPVSSVALGSVLEDMLDVWESWDARRQQLASALAVGAMRTGRVALVSALDDSSVQIALGLIGDGTEARQSVEIARLIATGQVTARR